MAKEKKKSCFVWNGEAYSISFLESPIQNWKTTNVILGQAQEWLVEQDINELLEKGTIQKAIIRRTNFPPNSFLIQKNK